ncbi:MAG: NB-ARC domain-containing protein, partial [Anaerolineae bacterium]
MHKDLLEAVHSVLRSWHTAAPEDLPWAEMLTVAQRLAASPTPDPALAVKDTVLEALNALEEQAGSEGAQILRLRFLDGYTATATANRLNLSEDMVYKRQRAAILELAQFIWQAELEACSIKEARIAQRLEIKDPPLLFGTDDKLAQLTAVLTSDDSPWLVAVIGIGGIGKTSLADAGVRALASRPIFDDIAWVSARQERFVVWNGLQAAPEGTPALTVERFVDAVIQQFGFDDLSQLALDAKVEKVRARLKERPYLVVIDNLETAVDYRALVPTLLVMTNPTKILLTSRHSLHDYPGILCLSLDELSAADSLALLRHEARERGMRGVATAPDDTLRQVHDVAGGNPLALKLLVGQMHTLSLPRVVEALRQARGQKIEELYRFIYWRSWQLLSDESRRVLAIMPLVAESGGGLAQIAALSEVAEEKLAAPLNQLVTLCLVNVLGTIEARRYGIHRLTETFLLNEVLKWQTES